MKTHLFWWYRTLSFTLSAEFNLVLFEKHPNFLFFIYRCTFNHDTVSSLIGIDCVLTVFACFCVAALSMQILKPAGFVETSHYPLLLLVYVRVDVVTQVDEEQQCFHSQHRFKTYWSRDTLLRPFSSWMLNARPPVHPVILIMFLSSGLFGCPSLCSSNLSFSLCLRIPNHNSLNVVYQSDREHCAASASVDVKSTFHLEYLSCVHRVYLKNTLDFIQQSWLCNVFVSVQRRDSRWPDGGGAVPHGLGHGAGEQLRRHRGALRRTRQRLPGHQPAAPHPEEAGSVRGAGPEGRSQVRLTYITASLISSNTGSSLLTPF